MLSAQGLELWRGDRCLFRDLDLAVPAGRTLSLHGPNGSGKTSLLRLLSGLTWPDEGHVRWRGEPIQRQREILHAEMSWLGHRHGLNAELSARENVTALLGLRRRIDPAELDATLARLGLGAAADLPLRRLSAGQQRRCAFARLLLEQTRLWLLDEPLANLDAAGSELIEELIDAHTATGGLAVVATHRCLPGDRVDVLELGRTDARA